MTAEHSEELLTTPEAAHLLTLSPRALERHRLAGTGPRYAALGRAIRYPQARCARFRRGTTFAEARVRATVAQEKAREETRSAEEAARLRQRWPTEFATVPAARFLGASTQP